MAFNPNINGTYRTTVGVGVNVGGTWHNGIQVSTNVDGVWKTIWTAAHSYSNLLGTMGSCENASNMSFTWALNAPVLAAGGVSGNCIAGTATSDGGMMEMMTSMVAGKYYFVSAYLKSSGGSQAVLLASISQYPTRQIGENAYVSSTSWVRTGIRVSTNGLTMTNPRVGVANILSGVTAYVDNIMVMEITADEFNYPVSQLLDLYPYKNS